MIPLGTSAPDFRLPAVNPEVDLEGETHRTLDDYADRDAVVVVFMCNHCPYVKTIEDRLIQLARDMESKGVAFIGICSNDSERYPDDSYDELARRAREMSYPFPYLHDESQEIAKAFGAVCTPDFFLFDRDRKLAYRGRLDDGTPGRAQTTTDLRDALNELLGTGMVRMEQHPSIGCNIKWREAASD